MQSLYKPSLYPPGIRQKLGLMPPLATEIANRWALGWPEAVTELLKAGKYLEALTAQEQAEREALSEPGNSHLARHEIAQEYGLTLGPPTMPPTS
jgi:hypothetical protein